MPASRRSVVISVPKRKHFRGMMRLHGTCALCTPKLIGRVSNGGKVEGSRRVEGEEKWGGRNMRPVFWEMPCFLPIIFNMVFWFFLHSRASIMWVSFFPPPLFFSLFWEGGPLFRNDRSLSPSHWSGSGRKAPRIGPRHVPIVTS